jgi:hypothetical protein
MNIKFFGVYLLFLQLFLSSGFAQAQYQGQKPGIKETGLIIDSLSSALNRWYVYPAKARVMISSVREKFKKGAYNNAQNYAELTRLLHKDLQIVNEDRHLEIVFDPQLSRDIETPALPDTAGNRRAYEHGLLAAKEDNFAFRKVEILAGNIGYIRWDGFYEFIDEARPIVNAAFQFVSNTKALIIDMRYNGGGSPEMVLQMQNYFFQQKMPMNHIIDRNNDTIMRWTNQAKTDFKLNMPVYILTSRNTFSGAEDFTYGMKYAKRAIVVGDTTGGGAHPTRPFNIGPAVVAFIPTHRSINIVTNTDWEGIGVWPDVMVPSALALAKAQVLVFSELLSTATDEREKKMLQWNLVSNENKALLTKQIQDDHIKCSAAELLEHCGEYSIQDPNNPLPSIFITLKGNYIFRHLDNGAEDIRLIPVSTTKFVYDDDSGRAIEFVSGKNEGTIEMILTTREGEFIRNKKK